MPGRKKIELTGPFDYDRAHAELVDTMSNLHISRIDELPNIELYRDQMISIVTNELAPLYEEGEKIITGSMVNNYVKQHVMPAPQRKRYTRRHLATLLFVCILKRVLSMQQITQLFEMLGAVDVELAPFYDTLVAAFEVTLAACFADDREHTVAIEIYDRQGQPVSGAFTALLERTIGLVANKVYVEKTLDLEERRTQQQ